MFDRKLITSVIVIFVVSMALGFTIHGAILHGEYAKLPNLMRSEESAKQLFGLMFLANFIFAIGFSWIYVRGKEAKPWLGQGFRYGVAVALLAVVPMYLINFVVMPFPSDLVAQQLVFDSISAIVMGVVVAWLNR
jgi:hypothetical protein